MACGDAPLLSRAQSPHQYYRATRPAESHSPGAGASLAHAAYSSGRMSIAVGPLKGPCDGRGTNKPRHLDSPLSPSACTSREIPSRYVGALGVQLSSRLALALEMRWSPSIMARAYGMNRNTQRGTSRGGAAPKAFASAPKNSPHLTGSSATLYASPERPRSRAATVAAAASST